MLYAETRDKPMSLKRLLEVPVNYGEQSDFHEVEDLLRYVKRAVAI